MLTKVRAYSSWQSADELLLDDAGRAETDLIQIRNITGLGPVKAAVNTSPLGSVDGDSYVGSSVGSRNIVMTLKPNPDWATWSHEELRRILNLYFMPKRLVRLVFETDEISPVEIFGYVESNEPSIFSKDGEVQISVVCPYPYFTAVNPTVITGLSTGGVVVVDYNGSIETGINVKVTQSAIAFPTLIHIQVGDPTLSSFWVTAGVDDTNYFEMSSVPGQKYARNVNTDTGIITNLLANIQQGSEWPILEPGSNDFYVATDAGVQDWTLTYYERFGGL